MVSALVVHQKLAEKMSRVRTSGKTPTVDDGRGSVPISAVPGASRLGIPAIQ